MVGPNRSRGGVLVLYNASFGGKNMTGNNRSVILCCSCFNMSKKAAESFAFLFPNEVCPEIIKGRDRIYKFSQTLNNDHIKALAKLSGKFAYYIKLNGDKIVEEYNLITGKRVA